jgi:hypothetical protein
MSTDPAGPVRGELHDFQDGRDEMNLVEFPLSAVADRFLDGRKTVVFTDQVWDRDQRQYLKRELAISGSDRYGLPTAKDEDVLLACLQLTRLDDFRRREVYFTRYELLKLLRWPDDGKAYQRLATSLRRWKGVTLFSDRAFYDHAHKSWVNRDFGIFDNLYLYERESATTPVGSARSCLVWNEVLFNSFQAGYLKRLDWTLYCELTDPVAKRLYRLLDKRFFHDQCVTFDLHDLALRKLRLSPNYNTAQIKRALAKGIGQLESCWALRTLPPEQRYVKQGRGQWQVVFQRKSARQSRKRAAEVQVIQGDLEMALVRREIGPGTAAVLVAEHPAETIQTMIELFDWYASRNQAKGVGFLVDSIRQPEKYRFPAGFESSVQRSGRLLVDRQRHARQRAAQTAREERQHAAYSVSQQSFLEFWGQLDRMARTDFEIRALTAAAPLKRDGYHRLRASGGPAFEQYRQVILRDYYQQTKRAG